METLKDLKDAEGFDWLESSISRNSCLIECGAFMFISRLQITNGRSPVTLSGETCFCSDTILAVQILTFGTLAIV